MARNKKGESERVRSGLTGATYGLLLLAGILGDGAAKADTQTNAPTGTVVVIVLDAQTKTPIVGAEVRIAAVLGKRTTDSTGVAVVHEVPTGRRSVVIWASELIRKQQGPSGRTALPELSMEFRGRRSVMVRAEESDTLVFRLKPSKPIPVTWQWEP